MDDDEWGPMDDDEWNPVKLFQAYICKRHENIYTFKQNCIEKENSLKQKFLYECSSSNTYIFKIYELRYLATSKQPQYGICTGPIFNLTTAGNSDMLKQWRVLTTNFKGITIKS